ncbi:hypothetical protein [Mesorhizobium marinum]|uniref:hypothetical protein n=1 Tax=Mesorhizobium marinum TaxID=3228790 RepID=UPI0034671AB9
MASSLSSKLDRLEAEMSPPSRVTTIVTYVWSQEEYEARRREQAGNIFAEGDVYFLSWLPPEE